MEHDLTGQADQGQAPNGDFAARYQRDGYAFPFDVLAEDQVTDLRDRYNHARARDPEADATVLRSQSHMVFPWLYDLVGNDRILDAVEQVIGPNILAWSSGFFAKQAHDGSFVTWHQDSTYWRLAPADIITAWVALTQSRRENGCMRVIPGSHTIGQIAHSDTFAGDNLLSRGQEIEMAVDDATAVDIELEPGQMSLHHVRIVHGSQPNPSPIPRVGFTIRYIPTYCRQIGARTTAMLVRGADDYDHFDPVPRPAADCDAPSMAFHQAATAKLAGILFDGAAEQPHA